MVPSSRHGGTRRGRHGNHDVGLAVLPDDALPRHRPDGERRDVAHEHGHAVPLRDDDVEHFLRRSHEADAADEELLAAARLLVLSAHTLSEPGAAAGLAALSRYGRRREFGKTVVLVITGANVEEATLARLFEPRNGTLAPAVSRNDKSA